MAIVEVQDVTKIYSSSTGIFRKKKEDIFGLKNASFSLDAGEVVGLIGPNGAGKSTTMKLLVGILHPTHGKVRLFGMDPTKKRIECASRYGIFRGHKPNLSFHLPPIDSFKLLRKIYRIGKDEFNDRLDMLTGKLSLNTLLEKPVRKMSLGQKMRCELAAILLHRPSIIFLDEPTLGLDIVTKREFRKLLIKLNEEDDVTILMSSHDLLSIEEACSRFIVLQDNSIVFDGSRDELDMGEAYSTVEIIFETAEDAGKAFSLIKDDVGENLIEGKKLLVQTKPEEMSSILAQLFAQGSPIEKLDVHKENFEGLIEKFYR